MNRDDDDDGYCDPETGQRTYLCPFGKDDFAHCFRCHSQNGDVWWSSCANRQNRQAYAITLDKDD